MTTSPKICVRCNLPVEANADSYEIFERMHWLCFHLEFEHHGDPDRACDDPGCPWWHIQVFRQKLVELGHDPKKVLSEAMHAHWQP